MKPFEGVRVVEVGGGIAASYATKLFADFGAEVIKVEPPEGDLTRTMRPFVGNEPGLDRSAIFLHTNTNKRSVVLDLHADGDRDQFRRLAASADVVVESFAPGVLDSWGLGFEDLKAVQPRTVLVSITPFGQSGPYARYKSSEIVAYGMGGPMIGNGQPDDEPLKLGGYMAQYQTGNAAATAALGALTMAEARDGHPVHVDISALEVQLASSDRRTTFLLNYAYTGEVTGRSDVLGTTLPIGLFPTADGYVQIVVTPVWIPRMLATLQSPELNEVFAQIARDLSLLGRPETKEAIDAALYPWLLERTREEVMEAAQANKWPVTALKTPLEVIEDKHFAKREFFVELDHPILGPVLQPGAPFRMTEGWEIRSAAPQLGADTDSVISSLSAKDVPPVVSDIPTRLPLDGVRVLDMTVVWSGPNVTMLLSDLGADVIRVDNPWIFPSSTRGLAARPNPAQMAAMGPMGTAYPDKDPGEFPWDRAAMFNWHARGKRLATLDLRKDSGREVFLRLIKAVDVFVENNNPAVLQSLGIDWDVLHEANPKLVVLRMPPAGLEGPYSTYLGFGAHFEAVAGITAVRGYREADPSTTTSVFQMDPTAGSTGAFAVMAALRRRERTGQGELVVLPQVENEMNHIGEMFIDAAANGNENAPMGNRDRNAIQGVYRCQGEDQWVAISVSTEEEWAGLVKAMANPAWALDETFATAEGRLGSHDQIDTNISQWTSKLSAYEVFHALQSQGVPAGPVLNEAGAFYDPHIRARGFFQELDSLRAGRHQYPGHQWKWTGPDLRWLPISGMGGDNEFVYRELLGMSDEEYAQIEADGHLANGYLNPDGSPM